jgi:biotin carboxylase
LLLVPAVTYRATDFLVAASRLELDLIIGSNGALPLGGRPVVHVDPDDPSGGANRLAARVGAVDAVVGVDTQMLVTAAKIAAYLGLSHNPVDAVMAAANKAEQRRLWAQSGVSQPRFRAVSADAAEHTIPSTARKLGFPCVVKPISLSGSRGVLRADDEAEATGAVTEVRGILAEAGAAAHDPILIEEYVPGWELSIDGLLTDGALAVTAIFDKPDTPEGPTFEETMLITPSRLPETILDTAIRLAERAAVALGLRYGPIHAELRIDDRNGERKPVMLELAARSIGGLCSRSLRFLGGLSLEATILLNSLGSRIAPRQRAGAAGVLMLPVEQAGVLHRVDGCAEAMAEPRITGLSITIPLGTAVRPLPWGDRYLGFIFAEGSDVDEVQEALRNARRQIRAVIATGEHSAAASPKARGQREVAGRRR